MNINIKDSVAKAMSSMVQNIDNVSYDLQTGKTGIKTDGGLITLGKDNVLEQNPMDFFSIELPAFAMLTPVNQVKPGDILVSNGKAYAFILETGIKDDTEESKASIRTMNLQGHISRFRPKRVSMMGINDGLTIVRSFNNLFGDAENEGMNMSNLMPFMMLSGSKDMSEMLPLMMMMGGNNGNNQMFNNPFMLMAMMGDKNPFG